MKTKKIGIISQARMTSTRLPGKVLKTINNIPLLKYHIDRLSTSEIPVFIATTTNEEDDAIIEFCENEGIKTFRGGEHDVLERYYLCAKMYALDIVVRVTSDCPLIDGKLIKEGVANYLNEDNKHLYLSNTVGRSFPRGLDFEIFSIELLTEAFKNATLAHEREHVTPYFYQGKNSRIIISSFDRPVKKNNYRITVDTLADFQLIETLIKDFNCHLKSTDQIIQLLDEKDDLVQINSHIEQKKLEN